MPTRHERGIRSRSGFTPVLVALVGIVIISLLMLGVSGLVLRQRVAHAIAATEQLFQEAARQDLPAACASMPDTAAAWKSAGTLSRPLAPVLGLLGWVPGVGPDLRMASNLVALAEAGSSAGATGCALLGPALEAATGPERLAIAARQLSRQPQALTVMLADLKRAQMALGAVMPTINSSKRLAPYRDQLIALDDQLPSAITALETGQRLAPHLPWLLGLDEARRFLLVLQNPFEIRPTGGFMGLVCVLRIEQARTTTESCKPSEAYNVAAPPTMTMPVPYTRYLRLGNYYLRDANWSPDFPTTAERLHAFWALNGQAPVDGIIAADLYALIPLVQATGPLDFDGTSMDVDHVVDAVLANYYGGSVYRDKGRIGQFLPDLLKRVLDTDVVGMRDVAAALQTALAERHVFVALNNEAVMPIIAEQGWDGRMAPIAGDSLRIVEADVGYGGVNAFVERLTHYDVALNDQAAPVSATLTLTFTNRYSPWNEAPTSHTVYGECTDPETLQLERRLGCYASYLRVYVPDGSQLLETSGLEEAFDADRRYGRAVFGGYFRVNPGEQRVVRFRYRLPDLEPGSLVIEKQSGTIAPPILVTAHNDALQAELQTSARTDLRLTYTLAEDGLTIEGPADEGAIEAFARHGAFMRGLALWEAGDHGAAAGVWQEGGAQDRALDHVRLLAERGADADALALAEAIAATDPSGRGVFEQATLLEARGDAAAADQLYQQAAERNPANPLAWLTWARRLATTGGTLPELRHVPLVSSAVVRWRWAAKDLEARGALVEAIPYVQVLRQLTPSDGELPFRQADLEQRAGQLDAAAVTYEALAMRDDVWGLLAQARQARSAERLDEAAALYRQALPPASVSAAASYIGDGLRELGDIDGALPAYERAAELQPDSIWPLVAAGDMLRFSDPQAARPWYERARALDPETGYSASGYPDFALGRLLVDGDDFAAALPFLEAAVIKEPTRQDYRVLLDRVRAYVAPDVSVAVDQIGLQVPSSPVDE